MVQLALSTASHSSTHLLTPKSCQVIGKRHHKTVHKERSRVIVHHEIAEARQKPRGAPLGHVNRRLPGRFWITEHLLPPYLHAHRYSKLSGEVFPSQEKTSVFHPLCDQLGCTSRTLAHKDCLADATLLWSEPVTALVAPTTRLERVHVQVEILNMDSVWVQLQSPFPPKPISDLEWVSPCVNQCKRVFL